MTTVQTMLCAAVLGATLLAGCASDEDVLVTPNVTHSPYPATRGETLWAVAPLANESGVTSLDALALSDSLAAAVSEIDGISVLPVNRTLAAMSARDLRAIRTPREARLLAESLKVHGLIVGSITAYDPYDPPKLGLTLALYTTDSEAADPIDSRQLSSSYADRNLPRTMLAESPAAVVSEHLDAASHDVLITLREYAHGRHDPDSALSWKRYVASMELYSEFAAYHCVRKLVQAERRRLAATTPPAPATPPQPSNQAMLTPSPTLSHTPTGDPK